MPSYEGGAGDVLDALHQLDQLALLAGSTGAKPTPQLPVTTVVTPLSADGSERVVPEDLTVVVRVDVDPAGRHQGAVGVDPGRGGIGDPAADLHDPAVTNGDVADPRRCARAVDDRSPGDHVVEHPPPPVAVNVARG